MPDTMRLRIEGEKTWKTTDPDLLAREVAFRSIEIADMSGVAWRLEWRHDGGGAFASNESGGLPGARQLLGLREEL